MRNIQLLIIDDELQFFRSFRQVLGQRYAFEVASNVERGMELLDKEPWDAVLLDLSFLGKYTYDQGLKTILPMAVRKANGKFPIIVITSDDRPATASMAREKGAFTLLRKSQYSIERWDKAIREAVEQFGRPGMPTPKLENQEPFVSASPVMEELKAELQKLAEYQHSSVLLQGETGSGKEEAAKLIHRAKNDIKLPFVAVNMSELSTEIIESELFGHVKGAFTGAIADKVGYFEKAANGTLFLDEIGEIPTTLQVKLLRVIQERVFVRVGSTEIMPLKAQLVFATNRNLEQAILEGGFRQDFYERINTMSVTIPPLRERKSDIEPLIERFLTILCTKPDHPLLGKQYKQCFTPAALQLLLAYDWPGNVRELRNLVDKMLFQADFKRRSVIDEDLVPVRVKVPLLTQPNRTNPASSAGLLAALQELPETRAVERWSRKKSEAHARLKEIEAVFIEKGGNKMATAVALEMGSDQHLRYKILAYHRDFPELFLEFRILKAAYKL